MAIVFASLPFTAAAASNAKTIFDFLVNEMGLNSAAASGVLANIEYESSFNPNLWGDSGTSYGICQWHASRLENLKSFCDRNGYSWQSLTGQLYFLKYELNTNKSDTGYIIDRLDVPNTADGAYTAGYNWCYYFERPANKAEKSENRGNAAKNKYWPEYKIVFILGDLDEDGKLTSRDALMVIEYAVGSRKLTDAQKKAAETNGDGKITSEDALIILSVSIGKY